MIVVVEIVNNEYICICYSGYDEKRMKKFNITKGVYL